MELIKRSKTITVAVSELLHQSVSGTNVCKFLHQTNLDLKKFYLWYQLSDVSQQERHFHILARNECFLLYCCQSVVTLEVMKFP